MSTTDGADSDGANNVMGATDRRARKGTGVGRPLRILVADDNTFAAGLMRRLLMAEGHVVRTAGSVGDAVRWAAAERVDLLITDVALPDGTGFDLLRRVRDLGASAGVAGITLTGFGGEEPARLSAEAGFAYHLVKPVNFDALARAIAKLSAAASRGPRRSPP